MVMRAADVETPDKDIPPGTQAMLIRVDSPSSSGYHFLEGDFSGK